ncbi:hypothetical protein BGW36DRAFT_378129 [Talaromyces proteolyticus]|uniref:Uncharacterized protein n=1 Tax=Talaromyces proteolyticus TaxID=1131652 RepID=A0AAD4Q0H1_9EURO|nr:uncharacterized protein BGW36DRAFT_378129 [Talaromyces proteolyticus]KAH8697173.1 hypothetical protein BGW36DRAFT_378129 [Talaromyces proteolyticus]
MDVNKRDQGEAWKEVVAVGVGSGAAELGRLLENAKKPARSDVRRTLEALASACDLSRRGKYRQSRNIIKL